MKTIGLIGGMSWESTVTYYSRMNEAVKEKLGGYHSAKILMYNVDFAEIEECQSKGEWEKSGEILADAALKLEKGGANFILIGANTMHKVLPQIEERISIPVLHIADATVDALKEKGIKRVALLGTKYTMTQDFYRDRIKSGGIDVIIPDDCGVTAVNDIIYNELCLGIIKDESRKKLSEIISALANRGAEGVILGCTEIGLLIGEEDSVIPVFDTTIIHAEAAVKAALAN